MATKKPGKVRRTRTVARTTDGMRTEYDFSNGVRGKYADRYPRGSVVVTLDPDVAAAYPSSAAANDALRKLLPNAPSKRRRGGSGA